MAVMRDTKLCKESNTSSRSGTRIRTRPRYFRK